ncbi:MAG: sarcosine oxidase [Geminicoccaceae bacterium]
MSVLESLTSLPLPSDFRRRSPIDRKLRAAEAVFGEVAGAAVPVRYREGGEEERARELGLAELSTLPRLGFKGKAVLSQMNTEGVILDFRPNRAFHQEDGVLAAVLAMTEVLLLSPLAGKTDRLDELAAGWSIDTADGGYLAPRRDSHFWFMVTGRQAPAMFAKICAVDLRLDHFDNLAVAQTSIARSNAIVIREDRGETPAYHLLGDSASAGYMWDCLLDAMAEWRGRPVGLTALSALG